MAPWLYKICQNSGLKRNESSSHEEVWRKLKCIFLSGRSQCGKTTHYTIPFVQSSRKAEGTSRVRS